MSESLFARSFKIFTVVCAYWVVSISLVFLNKYLLSSDELKLDAPMFITWFQCIVSVFVLFLLSFLGDKYPNIDTFPVFHINLNVVKQILPLSVVFVGMITFNNLCLKYLDVAFYNVARALTTFFNVVFSYFILNEKTSMRAIGCCMLIICGFLLGVKEEGSLSNLSYKGVLFGVLGSLCVCLNAIYTKRSMPFVDGNIWRLQIYNNFNAIFLFIPLMLFNGEHLMVINFSHIFSSYFWIMMTLSGVFGIAIGYVTGLQIKVTSPLTHNISGTAKACFQTVIAVVAYSSFKSVLWWGCNFLVLGGSALYTYVKHNDMKVASKQVEKKETEM
ncbi:GDP-fucose transporter 1 isoform X3 [Hydra vulgaris]|uniref:GDP-fucose transporter 1 isoform X3 n=1 Tax=Hydra vulgaris TaxID=6087 RepID=A0ABM4D8A8_HYDVU